MTEQQFRSKFVAIAQNYLGCKESDGSHKQIIDHYNADKPLPRGYAMKYTDAWCACFVSVISIINRLTDIIPKEVSCGRMIELYKGMGRWEEKDSYVPSPGDIIFYDWDDDGKGDNTGAPEHVGIVVSVSGSTIQVIEGNISKAVGYRSIAVNGRYIRGYGLPDYASKALSSTRNKIDVRPVLKSRDYGADVKLMQEKLISAGFCCGTCGADGNFGNDTLAAVRLFQISNQLKVDGFCGPETQKALGLK